MDRHVLHGIVGCLATSVAKVPEWWKHSIKQHRCYNKYITIFELGCIFLFQVMRLVALLLGWPTYRSFLKHCTPTNQAEGTIWQDLFKPTQSRQGPDPRSLWLLFGTPQSLDLASLPDGRSIAYSGGCVYIVLIYCFYNLTCLCNYFHGLSALVGRWSSVVIRRIIYTFKLHILIFVVFLLHSFCGKWEGWDPVHRFNHTVG